MKQNIESKGRRSLQTSWGIAWIALLSLAVLSCAVQTVRGQTYELFFPQIGDGAGGGLIIKTSMVFFNTSGTFVSGEVRFFSDAGSDLPLRIGGVESNRCAFNLTQGSVLRITTAGAGQIKIGWASVTATKPISGAAVFSVFDSSGKFVSELGVPGASTLDGFSIFCDTIGDSNTSVAVANPDQETAKLSVFLIDSQGKMVQQAEDTLPARGHKALYVTELFPSVPGIDEFEGTIRFVSTTKLAALTLRTRGPNFTSLPAVP